jgi:hypothetical protein
MNDNGDFSEEEHSGADDDYEGFAHRDTDGEHEEAGGREESFAARAVAQIRTNDPSLSNHYLVIQPSVPDSCRLEIAETLTQNIVVQRNMLQLHHYSKLSTEAMAKYLIQSKRLRREDLMGESPILPDFPPGRSFGSTPQLCTFIEAVGHSTSVKHLNVI